MITMTNMCMEKPAACLYVEYINIYICIHREKGDRGGRMKLIVQKVVKLKGTIWL